MNIDIVGHASNLAAQLRRLATQIEVDDSSADWPAWRVEANERNGSDLVLRFISEFEEDDDPTIMWTVTK